ncbi:hypothetical protein J18TS1_28030 [Oceanobacillus oncorhynchi subsp. incaldanensis]|uniref:DEAD/DEAH box helicase n=1 Tax=Oceanobacillus oncorhynchi TaxID=545501 RepID=UPI001B26FDEC|nr:DEAD/DEAH box helicase [Oceanobacillus oncorhynchi]GIO19703.1 hypothetical protein J18TS1_28030 [Oceanobacillus oncorhynchi subsp. incaldanensis]
MKYSIDAVSDSLTNKLKEYLETQYPLTNPEIQQKRRRLLNEPNLLSTTPFIESTPVYKQGKSYENMDIPNAAKEIMTNLSQLEPSVGVYSAPYEHQQKAMEHFLNNNDDIIVSTGTGSGKTESFLHPMLSKLYTEAVQRPQSFKKRAVRALVLYPMNALVNDQMSRLRLLYGDERVKSIFKDKGNRPVTFGMYTSRTPYAGTQSYNKDKSNLNPLLDYYIKIEEENPVLATDMKMRGRWIAKDIKKFKNSKVRKTKDTYKTSVDDAELFTRHEMQNQSPDILVTNYSMLEYMLMRPIERNIWEDTRSWLAEDDNNEFMLILDEAHMYRGTGGAEVALLIRRLQHRLGIPRDRMRCILTSASMGKEGDTESAEQFAQKLTGKLRKRSISLIEGVKEIRGETGILSKNEFDLFSKINIKDFHNRFNDYKNFYDNQKDIFEQLDWEPLPENVENLEMYLFEQLFGYPPLEKIISLVSGNAHTLEDITKKVYPAGNVKEDLRVISTLIILSNAAKKNGRVLLPARVHMFFRGISGIYLCLNSDCTANKETDSQFGKIYETPRIQCECGSRVYELLTHIQCGSAFIRTFINQEAEFPKFTWNEKGKGIVDDELTEVHLYIENQPNKIILEKEKVRPIWLDLKTGYLFDKEQVMEGLLKLYITNEEPSKRKNWYNHRDLITFEHCPSCAKDAKGNIRDLKTKGEPPFANIVREQFIIQPPVRGKEEQQNNGRKVLIFSDGRQKAARLARDIPREVEKDVLRQMIIVLSSEFKDLRVADYYTYLLLLMKFKGIELLEGKDKKDIEVDKYDTYQLIKEELDDDFNSFNVEGLKDIINDLNGEEIKSQFEKGLETIFYQALIAPGYSLYDTTVGYLAPSKRALHFSLKKVKGIMSEKEFFDLSVLFIKIMQDNVAFNQSLNHNQRCDILSQNRSNWGIEKNKHYQTMKEVLKYYEEKDRKEISQTLFNLCESREGKYYINPAKLKVVNGIKESWYKCDQCRTWHPVIIKEMCPTCFSKEVELHRPNSETLISEKGYWRKPVEDTLKGADIFNFNVEEHSAQLSQKDVKEALATTEKYELGFQDIKVDDQDIVDILSCTTTMEVGIDIGSLTAVAMRNIPPFRENYQQRAGRAGRRSTNLSTVITYAQDSPHDHYYFANADKMISGDSRQVNIYIDNKKILKRHINALLIQTFFHETLLQSDESELFASLGKTNDFFEEESTFSIHLFDEWITENVGNRFREYSTVFEIIPVEILQKENQSKWEVLLEVINELVNNLKKEYSKIRNELQTYLNMETEDISDIPYYQNQDLLTFLFNHEFLPTYAFPRDLSSFYIQKRTTKNEIQIAQRPQLELNRALNEYAPGKLVVIDKETYRVGGIYNPYSQNGENSVRELFKTEEFVSICSKCYFTQLESSNNECPNCGNSLFEMPYIRPFGFSAERGESLRRNEINQEYSYAGAPQLPIPNEKEKFKFKNLEANNDIQYVHAANKDLIVLNRGSHKDSGFLMCEDCGYIIGNSNKFSRREYHIKPFITNSSNECYGKLQKVYLGNRFSTDLLLIRMRLTEKIYFEPNMKWIHDALDTVGEAFVIAASRVLEIEINELGVGYRMIRNGEEELYADIYIYDKLSGGAGYSYVAGEKINLIFKEIFNVLSYCEGDCDQSCYKCLRYYENQFKHSKLDRYLALDLLSFLVKGEIRDYKEENKLQLLGKIQQLNNLLHLKSQINKQSLQIELATGVIVKIRNNIVKVQEKNVLFFSPYEIINDLPNVYKMIKNNFEAVQFT